MDSSAILAVVLNEAGAEACTAAMIQARRCRMSAANWLEATLVVDNAGDPTSAVRFDELIATLNIQVEPFTASMAITARAAHRRYGRGRHPAKLNFGDCFAYALAAITGEPLLFKGNDFPQTDITPALT